MKRRTMYSIGQSVRWGYKGHNFVSPITHRCPYCKAIAVIALPAPLLAEQPDDTTHVCHPSAGGCNQGFALDDPSPNAAKANDNAGA